MSRNNDGLPMLPPWLSESEVTQVGYEAPVQNLPHEELIEEAPARRGRFKSRAPEGERPDPNPSRRDKRRRGWRRDKDDQAEEQQPDPQGHGPRPGSGPDPSRPGGPETHRGPESYRGPEPHRGPQPQTDPNRPGSPQPDARHDSWPQQRPDLPGQVPPRPDNSWQAVPLPTRNPSRPSAGFQPLGSSPPEPPASIERHDQRRPDLPPPPSAPDHAATQGQSQTAPPRPANSERTYGPAPADLPAANEYAGADGSVPPSDGPASHAPTQRPKPHGPAAEGPNAFQSQPDGATPPPRSSDESGTQARSEHGPTQDLGHGPEQQGTNGTADAPRPTSEGWQSGPGEPWRNPAEFAQPPVGPQTPTGYARPSMPTQAPVNDEWQGPTGFGQRPIAPYAPGGNHLLSQAPGSDQWQGQAGYLQPTAGPHAPGSSDQWQGDPAGFGQQPPAGPHAPGGDQWQGPAGYGQPPVGPHAPSGDQPTPQPPSVDQWQGSAGYGQSLAGPHAPSGNQSMPQAPGGDQWQGGPAGFVQQPPVGPHAPGGDQPQVPGGEQWHGPAGYGQSPLGQQAPDAAGYGQPPGGYGPAAGPGGAPSRYQPGAYDQHVPQPSLDDIPLKRAKKSPSSGWRKAVHHVSGGAINPGLSAEEIRLQELVARIRQPVRGDYRIAVLSLKGGVGKTTTTMGLGSIFASIRGDRVIAVDANPDFGTLSQRVPLQTRSTVRDLLLDPAIQRYSDVRRHTSQGTSRLEVLASERDPAASEAFSDDEYRAVARILQRFYNIVLTDCGTGLMHSAMGGVLDLAHSLVLISSAAIDGARSAAATLDWLSLHGHDHLVRNAVVVINLPREGSPNVGIQQLREYFLSRCRAVHVIPYDVHLSEGAEIDLHRLHKTTKRAYVELAATVADEFSIDHRR